MEKDNNNNKPQNRFISEKDTKGQNSSFQKTEVEITEITVNREDMDKVNMGIY